MMKQTYSHGLGSRTKARAAVEQAFAHYQERFASHHPTITWQRDDQAELAFSVMGKQWTAKATVDDDALTIEGDIPFLMKPFEGKIREAVGKSVSQWIERAKNQPG